MYFLFHFLITNPEIVKILIITIHKKVLCISLSTKIKNYADTTMQISVTAF